MEADTNFYIDRMFGLPIVVPVLNGIVQEFNDQEYNGHLSNKSAGKHISELKDICTNKLYKTWVKNWSIGKVYNSTSYNKLQWQILNLKKEIERNNSTVIVRFSDYYRKESENDFNQRRSNHEMTKKQAVNMLAELEEKFKEAQEKINLAKLQVFNEHQIQF